MYSIVYDSGVEKELRKIPAHSYKRIIEKLLLLQQDPHASFTEQLRGSKQKNRKFRVGNYRIIYNVKNDQLLILVLLIEGRDKSYR